MQFTVITPKAVYRVNAKSHAHITKALNEAKIKFLSVTQIDADE